MTPIHDTDLPAKIRDALVAENLQFIEDVSGLSIASLTRIRGIGLKNAKILAVWIVHHCHYRPGRSTEWCRGYNDGYQKGRADAWKLAKRIERERAIE